MLCAAKKVLEKFVSKVKWNLSRNIVWFKDEIEWEYSGSHVFGLKIMESDSEDVITDYVKKN
jgi:hypothetical protein